jgi:hypothetical protein
LVDLQIEVVELSLTKLLMPTLYPEIPNFFGLRVSREESLPLP